MDLSHTSVQIFNQGGILKRQLDYSDLQEQCGKPVAVSNNGQIFLFKQSKTMRVSVIVLNLDLEENDISMKMIKTVDISEAIQYYVDTKEADACGRLRLPKEEIAGAYKNVLDPSNCTLNLTVNDNMDIVAQLKPKQDMKNKFAMAKVSIRMDKDTKENFEEKIKARLKEQLGSIIYMQRGIVGINTSEELWQNETRHVFENLGIKPETEGLDINKQALFLAKEQGEFGKLFASGLSGVAMNTASVFFWNNFRIWYLSIAEPTEGFSHVDADGEVKENKLGLYVSPEEKQTAIKKVRTGSNEQNIMVQVK